MNRSKSNSLGAFFLLEKMELKIIHWILIKSINFIQTSQEFGRGAARF